jgi:hypothetical protein
MSTSGSREAVFIGRITASVTHEIRNVLAIVKESAGLIDDLVQVATTRGLDGDRVLKATGRIDAQVARGADLLTGLNRLAHSLDQEREAIDLEQEVRQVAFLSQRFGRKKIQTVRAVAASGGAGLTANSLHVKMALFAAVELLMEHLPEGAVIDMGVAEGERAAVRLTGRKGECAVPPPATGSPAWDRTREIVQDLGAALDATESGDGLLLAFGGAG